jgi:hypothetical protein
MAIEATLVATRAITAAAIPKARLLWLVAGLSASSVIAQYNHTTVDLKFPRL